MLIQISQVADTMQTAANIAAAAAPKEDSLNLLDLLLKGGVVMIPIGILSIICIYVLLERYLTIRRAGKMDKNFMNTIKDFIHNGNIESAKALCKNNDSPIAKVIGKGISRIGKPIKEIESAMENTGRVEISMLEKNINVLGIIAGIAPMFGFIGTIAGVIKIFYNISLADNISIGLIAGGLYEKMITSASGLIIGIFAFVGFHLMHMMVDKIVRNMEIASVEFIDILEEPTK